MDFVDVIKAWAENPATPFRRKDLHGALTKGKIHGPGEIIRKGVLWAHEDGTPAKESIFALDERYGRWLVHEVSKEDILADDWEEVPQDVVDDIIKAGKAKYDMDLKRFLEDTRKQKEE